MVKIVLRPAVFQPLAVAACLPHRRVRAGSDAAIAGTLRSHSAGRRNRRRPPVGEFLRACPTSLRLGCASSARRTHRPHAAAHASRRIFRRLDSGRSVDAFRRRAVGDDRGVAAQRARGHADRAAARRRAVPRGAGPENLRRGRLPVRTLVYPQLPPASGRSARSRRSTWSRWPTSARAGSGGRANAVSRPDDDVPTYGRARRHAVPRRRSTGSSTITATAATTSPTGRCRATRGSDADPSGDPRAPAATAGH